MARKAIAEQRMAELGFSQEQLAGIMDPRVRAVNAFVDQLHAQHPDRGVPYIPPHYNAAAASILVMSSNPGPQAAGTDGSGFLSRQNNDFSAARMNGVFEAVGLSDEDALPWNVCPWDIHSDMKGRSLLPPEWMQEGLEALRSLFDVCGNLRVVIAHGEDAKQAMRLFTGPKYFKAFAEERDLKVFETRHTSPRWFNSIGPERREIEMLAMRQVYRDAMGHAGLVSLPEPVGSAERTDVIFPQGMFGYVPDWLPTIIGRTVMVAALVEGKVDSLLMNLSGRLQNTYAGKPVGGNVDLCRKALVTLEDDNPEFVASTRALLDDVEEVLKRRNAIVHSLWPDNTIEAARGWRNLPPAQREPSVPHIESAWTEWVEIDRHGFNELVDTFIDLVDRLVDAIASAGSIPVPRKG